MITVRIDEETAIEMLVERVAQWADGDEEITELYRKMYESYVYGGVYDGGDFNINAIVDNDYINWTRRVYEGDDDYEDIREWYEENGCGDCSCDLDTCDYVEAEYNGIFLVR